MGGHPVVQPQPERKHDEYQTLNIKVHLAMSATSRIRWPTPWQRRVAIKVRREKRRAGQEAM